MVRIKHALPKRWKGRSALKRELWAKHRWMRLLASKDAQQTDGHLHTQAAEEDEENLPQPNLEESSMEQPDSRSVDAEVRKDTEDDVILHPVTTISETLYLEHTVTQQEENMQSKKKEDLQSEKEIPEIVDEEPLLACSDVPFEYLQFTTPASKKAMAKRTGSRWSLRQKAKENQESEGIEEIQTKEVKKKELKRKEKATDDQEESSKKQKTSSSSAKHIIRSQINQRKNAKAEKSPKPGKFSKQLFVSSITSSYMSEIAKKTILPQRSIDVEDFEAKTNLIPVLKKCNLLKSITLPGSYVRKVIQEFYCNLSEGCNIHTNSSYHKVFMRGKTFDLSPTKINQFLNIKPPSSEFNVNERQVWTDLTNGERISQSTKSKVSSSILKNSYAILFRIISFASERAKQNSNGLPYPLLIYQMLKSQKLVVADEEEPAPPLLQVDLRHFEGRHYNDMATREEQKTAPSILQSNFSKTAFIKGEIQLLQEKIEEYKKLIEEAEIKKKKWAIIISSLDTTPDEVAKSLGGKSKQDESDDAATQGEQSEDDEAT
ncbi:unnamed protein product [Cuscuta campestris]|uniref:Uncharacterized protein n=1 Tax=Cuscuta campestris TaxID=132261 RepID=A0A484M4Y7_9ASTE|nr:unnamed protein product [Cuscuta campestris]